MAICPRAAGKVPVDALIAQARSEGRPPRDADGDEPGWIGPIKGFEERDAED